MKALTTPDTLYWWSLTGGVLRFTIAANNASLKSSVNSTSVWLKIYSYSLLLPSSEVMLFIKFIKIGLGLVKNRLATASARLGFAVSFNSTSPKIAWPNTETSCAIASKLDVAEFNSPLKMGSFFSRLYSLFCKPASSPVIFLRYPVELNLLVS